MTIALEGTRAGAEAFVRRAGLTAPVILGDDAIAGHFRVLAYPWTVILDRSGKPVTAIRGGRDEAQFRKLFQQVL